MRLALAARHSAAKSNPNHDGHGRFSGDSGGGSGGAHDEEPDVSEADAKLFEKHDNALEKAHEDITDLHDKISDHLDALKKLHKQLGNVTAKGNAAHDGVNEIREKYDLDPQSKEGTVLEHGEEIHEALGEAVDGLKKHVSGKYAEAKRTSPLADFFETAREFKFSTEGLPLGEFKGYGAVFGNVDSHGDVILPGAFLDTLAERKAQDRGLPPMHVMHSFFGGDGLPVGKWLDMQEDAKGLRVHGKVSGPDTETGKLHLARIADGAYGGLSIGYAARKDGAEDVSKAARPDGAKRLLKKLDLFEVSLVDEPSNAQAKFDGMKAAQLRRERKDGASAGIGEDDEPADPAAAVARAASALRACLALHAACMVGGDSPDAAERAEMLGHLQDAHEALTGQRIPTDAKSLPSIRTCEKALRDAGLTRPQALAFVDAGLKRLHEPPRDAEERRRQTSNQDDATKALETARDALSFLP